jgi:hypothetical protein
MDTGRARGRPSNAGLDDGVVLRCSEHVHGDVDELEGRDTAPRGSAIQGMQLLREALECAGRTRTLSDTRASAPPTLARYTFGGDRAPGDMGRNERSEWGR